MENVEPFECCPSIGRHVSYTHVPKQVEKIRTKSSNPIDRVAEKLSRKIVPLKPFGDVLFKALDEETKKRNAEAATVSRSSIKPYTKWLDEWEPGDPLPLIPPGFRFALCDDISGGRLVNRDKKKKPRIGPLNDADLAMMGRFDEKSLGPKIKDSVYSLLSMVSRARGLWVDDKNKLRCPPGTPNANQFTDITGSNCFIPVPLKPTGAISSGARAARRAAGALRGAMNPGARDYPGGFGGQAYVGARENFARGRSMIVQATATASDFKQGLFRLPGGQAITHFRPNAQGRTNFLLSVQELMPNVDLAQAAEFWDNMLENAPLTALQKAQMEDYIESFFQSWFMEAKEHPDKMRWITHLQLGSMLSSANAWEVDLRGTAGVPNKKGVTVYDKNMPVSQSGFKFSLMFNPVAAYYMAKGDGSDKRHTGHGSQINMRSQGLYTGTHEFGHLVHFSQAMKNMGFDPLTLKRGKGGEWLVDLRNIQNPTSNPEIDKLKAMITRIEAFQSGSAWQTLPSGQKVRVYAKDTKEAVTEFYSTLYQTMTNDVGGTEEDFKLLAGVVGADYAHSNYVEARAEAYAVIRHFGPQVIDNYAREQAAYQASNPRMFPTPEPEDSIRDNIYQAMNRIFYSVGYGKTPDEWHSRNSALGVNTLLGASVKPTGSSIPATPTARSGLSRFIPFRKRGTSGPGLSGPMAPRRINATNRTGRLSGALSSTQRDLYVDRPKNSDTMPLRIDARKAFRDIDTTTADLLAGAEVISDSIDLSDVTPEGGVLIEAPGVFEKLAKQAGIGFIHSMNQTAYVNDKAMVRRASGTQLTREIDQSFENMRRPRYRNYYLEMMEFTIDQFQEKIEKKDRHIAKIKALQAKAEKDRNNPDLAAEIHELSYPGLTLDETLKKLEFKKRRFKKEVDEVVVNMDRLVNGDVNAIANDRKNVMQTMVFATLAAVKKVTDRYPQLKDVLVSLDPHKGQRPGGNRAMGYAGLTFVSGRIIPNFKINPPLELPDLLTDPVGRLAEDVDDPDFDVPGNYLVGDFAKSNRLTMLSTGFHEMGHNLDTVAQLNGMGIKTGFDSAPVIGQLRSAGPELGDSVPGALYALATGRPLNTKLDNMGNNEKSALVHFTGWALGANGHPRENMLDGGRVRALALSGVYVENKFLPGTLDVDTDVSRSLDYQIMELGTAEMIAEDTVGGFAMVMKGKEKDVNRITKRIDQILSDALGWDFNNGVFGTADGLLDSDGIVAESSKYAKTLRTERFAEGFTLMMLLDQYGAQDNLPDTVRPRQAATGLKNLIDGLPSRDSVVRLDKDQKDELTELIRELHDVVEFKLPNGRTRASKLNFDKEISDENAKKIGLVKYSEEKTVELATEKQIRQASPYGLFGAMGVDPKKFSGFETDQGSKYEIEPSGRVTRFKPTTGSTIEDKPIRTQFENTVFVSTEDLQALKVSFDRGVGIAANGKIVGLDYDDRSINKTTFTNLRKQGKSFDEAFGLAGGVITEREIRVHTEPSIGLHPFEWNNDGRKHHAGNVIVSVTPRTTRGQSLTGAMTAAKDFPEIPNPRMPKEAREGNYAYFAPGIWKEETHFPMANIIRNQFNTMEPGETVEQLYERISSYWGISPREVQRHVNEMGKRPYYDEPMVLPPQLAGVKFPNRRRVMNANSRNSESRQKTVDILAKASGMGVDIDRQEREIVPKLLQRDKDDRLRPATISWVKDRALSPNLTSTNKEIVRNLANDPAKSPREILRQTPGDDSFGHRLAILREISDIRGDSKLVAEIDDFVKELQSMTPEQFDQAIEEAVDTFESPFDNRPTVLMRSPIELITAGRYQTVHEGRKTQGGIVGEAWDVAGIRRAQEARLLNFPGDTDPNTNSLRPVSAMALQKVSAEERAKKLRNLYGDDIEIQHTAPVVGESAREAVLTGTGKKTWNHGAQYGRNAIVLRPETAERTLAINGDSVSDVSESGSDILEPGARLANLSKDGRIASMFFDPLAVLFEKRTGRKETIASAEANAKKRYVESLTVGGFDLTDVESIVSESHALRGEQIWKQGTMNMIGANPEYSFTNLIAAARQRDDLFEKYGIDVVIVDNTQNLKLDEVEPFNKAMTRKWVDRQISTGKFQDVTASEIIVDENTTPYEALLRYRKSRAEKQGSLPLFDHPENESSANSPKNISNFVSMVDEELERISPKTRSGLSGAMSSSNARMTKRQTGVVLAEEKHENAETRAKNMRKAIDELEKTGNWRGGDFGVVLGVNKDISADDIDADGITPQNRSAKELAATGRTTDQVLAQAREKLKKAEDEIKLQKHLAKSKQTRMDQNVLDIEDIDDATLAQLKKEQEELIRLRDTDRKAFSERFSTGKKGEVLVVHSGAAELEGGVLNPDKTQGVGGSPGAPGDTLALNKMQMNKIKQELMEQEQILSRANAIISKLNNKEKITVSDRLDLQLLRNLGKYLEGSKYSLGKMKIGDEIDLSKINEIVFPAYGARPERKQSINDLLDFVMNDRLNGINSQMKMATERVESLKPRVEKLMKSPRSGFTSSSPLTAGNIDSRGYFARYADRVIPEDSSGWLKARWGTQLRGTAWLVSGQDGVDIVSDLGPGDERQIIGTTKPIFGISAKRNNPAEMDEVSLAIMARAVDAIRAGKKPDADEILNDPRRTGLTGARGKLGGLSGAMSPDEDEVRRRTRIIEDLLSQGFSMNDIVVTEDGDTAVRYKIGNWIGQYKGGHIDIFHADKPNSALDLINLYDYEKGEYEALTPEMLRSYLQDWISEQGETWMENKGD